VNFVYFLFGGKFGRRAKVYFVFLYFSIPDTNHNKFNKTDKKESVEQAGRQVRFVHRASSCIR